jgi:hypothetical protein
VGQDNQRERSKKAERKKDRKKEKIEMGGVGVGGVTSLILIK